MEYLNQWKSEKNVLTRTFVFKNFAEAVDFVNDLVPISEKLNHHPDIEIFSYKNVKVKLTTHESGNITKKDIDFAKAINHFYDKD